MSDNHLIHQSYDDLLQYVQGIGESPFRAKQIFEWIYQKGATSFDEMKNLPQRLRLKLAEQFIFSALTVAKKQTSSDGTTKYLFTLSDNEHIETVLIPNKKRNTVCVSTQVGCKFGCKFCASGMSGFKRNLTTSEILFQILYINHHMPNAKCQMPKTTHVVFMGCGEPLDNYDHVLAALRRLNDPKAFGIAARRLTISTCGLIPGIKRLQEEKMQFELSVSLHAPDERLRSQLMPVNKKNPLKDLMGALRQYTKATNRQVTFEYVLVKDFNADEKCARKLCALLKGLLAKINLIVLNTVETMNYQPPTSKQVAAFRRVLKQSGLVVTQRRERGADIRAACGQLRANMER